MKDKNIKAFFAGIAGGAFIMTLFMFWGPTKMTRVHTLKAPMILVSNEPTQNLHLLPAGTTLYFDQSFPEGFTRYKVYINVDRMPLPLRDLADPTEIDPLEARPLGQPELAKALRDYPLTRQDLEAILRAKHLTRDEIKEVLNNFLASTQ